MAPAYPGLPNLEIPLLGDKWAVGLFFLVHVAFGSFTMGTLVLAPTCELLGRLRHSAPLLRYARWLAEINLRIFSIGATLAGFAVILLLGLYGRFFVTLVETFWIPFLVAFLIWFPAIAALYTWAHWWDRLAPSAGHIVLGYFAAAMDHVFLLMIVGIDSFLLTPGRGSGWGGFFNPSFFPELGHRFIGNISWASFLLAGISALLAGASRKSEDRVYFLWAAKLSLVVAFLTVIPQVLLGFSFAETLKHAEPAAFHYSFQGPAAWLWLLQGGLLGLLFVTSNLYFRLSRPHPVGNALTGVVVVTEILALLPGSLYGPQWFWLRYVFIGTGLLLTTVHWLVWRRSAAVSEEWRPGLAATLAIGGIAAIGLIFVMGIIRTTARDPYTVYGRMTQAESQGVFTAPPGHYP